MCRSFAVLLWVVGEVAVEPRCGRGALPRPELCRLSHSPRDLHRPVREAVALQGVRHFPPKMGPLALNVV